MTDDQKPYSKYDVLRRQPEVPNSKSYAQEPYVRVITSPAARDLA